MKLTATCACVFLLASPAWADNGWYGGLGLGVSDVEFDVGPVIGGGSATFDDGDTAWKLFGGFDLGEHLLIEGGWRDAGTPRQNFTSFDLSVEIDGLDAYGVGRLPLNDTVTLLGKAGLFFWQSTTRSGSSAVTDDGVDLAVGAGAEVRFSPHVALRGEFEWFDIDDTDSVWMLTVSPLLHFEN